MFSYLIFDAIKAFTDQSRRIHGQVSFHLGYAHRVELFDQPNLDIRGNRRKADGQAFEWPCRTCVFELDVARVCIWHDRCCQLFCAEEPWKAPLLPDDLGHPTHQQGCLLHSIFERPPYPSNPRRHPHLPGHSSDSWMKILTGSVLDEVLRWAPCWTGWSAVYELRRTSFGGQVTQR